MNPSDSPTRAATSRRQFLRDSTLAAAATGLLPLSAGAWSAGNETLRVGLIGCGGRGSKAAVQALEADPHTRLWAMGDAFEDRLEKSLAIIGEQQNVAARVDVTPERRFVGFDAYRHVIEACDVVLLTAPPHFRPVHLKAAIEAGKHVFAEKPVAVDAPGVRSVLESCRLADEKRLSVVSGLCLRYDKGFQECVGRIHDGALGEIRSLEANDYRGTIWMFPREPEWTDMHWQMRNWYYFTWLSGDFNVEQHVHYLDVCAWLKGEYPVKAVGIGGRQQRTGPEYGNIYDHHSVVYEFADGTKLYSNTRQQAGCYNEMTAKVAGEKGTAEVSERRHVIDAGGETWRYRGEHKNMYQVEHDELFASIKSGRPINNGEYMAYSTLLAIMGRMATYTGKQIAWEQALSSEEDLSPPKYEWGPLPTPAVAVPGLTKFV
ncbi:MAG: Gfo/Idh/MocA family oxidoreductase [Planctomycetes bacterium]|nr:Gfo/Idh/MocA family oxidoreductase [Planctomycetota bacterium]